MALETRAELDDSGMYLSTGGEKPEPGRWSRRRCNPAKPVTYRGFMGNPVERMGGERGGKGEGGRIRKGVVHGCTSTERRGDTYGNRNPGWMCNTLIN